MTPADAIAFIQKHGVVLESANGPVPSLVQAIVGHRIEGSWWGHPRGKEIFRLTREVRESDQVLTCRLFAGKITLVHRCLWPALVRCAGHFPPEHIARIVEQHTASGRHVAKAIPFPDWVPEDVFEQADARDEASAMEPFKLIVQRGADSA